MPILSTKKFLSLLAILLVSHSSFAVAGSSGLRSRRQSRERALKHSKSNSQQTVRPSIYRIPITQPPTVYPLSVEGIGRKCPNQENALDGCIAEAGGDDSSKLLCKTCIVSMAHFSSTTLQNLNSCSNPSVNGGYCQECYEDATNYYNCGTDSNLGNEADPSDDTGGNNGVDLDPIKLPVTSPPRQPAPISFCPFEKPVSGDACDTGSYDYLECYFPRLKCTCRQDSPYYLCNEYDPHAN